MYGHYVALFADQEAAPPAPAPAPSPGGGVAVGGGGGGGGYYSSSDTDTWPERAPEPREPRDAAEPRAIEPAPVPRETDTAGAPLYGDLLSAYRAVLDLSAAAKRAEYEMELLGQYKEAQALAALRLKYDNAAAVLLLLL